MFGLCVEYVRHVFSHSCLLVVGHVVWGMWLWVLACFHCCSRVGFVVGLVFRVATICIPNRICDDLHAFFCGRTVGVTQEFLQGGSQWPNSVETLNRTVGGRHVHG